jgi:hypothetical protein
MYKPSTERRIMSPQAGFVLQDQVVPRLRSAIPNCVHCVGAEDAQEMIQDSIAMAAKLMHNVEAAGKTVTPGIIAYYTIQHIRSGRRSAGSSVVDAMKRKIGQRYRSFTMMWSPRRPIIIGSKLASLAAETRNSGPKLKVTFAKPSRLKISRRCNATAQISPYNVRSLPQQPTAIQYLRRYQLSRHGKGMVCGN